MPGTRHVTQASAALAEACRFLPSRCKHEALQQYMQDLQDVNVEGTEWDTQEDQAACINAVDSWIADLKKAQVSRYSCLQTC